MIKIPQPASSCRKISELAARKARESARSFGWSSRTIEALVPLDRGDGQVGIQSKQKYIMHQERGIKSFLMTWVEGRIVPMGGPGGLHFRKGSHVGEPGWVNIPHVGRVYREQRWRHPGIKPKHFMEQALTDAIAESRHHTRADAVSLLKGGRR